MQEQPGKEHVLMWSAKLSPQAMHLLRAQAILSGISDLQCLVMYVTGPVYVYMYLYKCIRVIHVTGDVHVTLVTICMSFEIRYIRTCTMYTNTYAHIPHAHTRTYVPFTHTLTYNTHTHMPHTHTGSWVLCWTTTNTMKFSGAYSCL